MKSLDRRTFLKQSLLTTASLSLFAGCTTSKPRATSVHSRVRGANEDIRVAVVGFNGRGQEHISSFSKMPGVRLVALCDSDKTVLASNVKKLGDAGTTVEGYTDIRKLLENDNVDVVSIATPNHWHALGTIWSVQAGKDVYVEKPISHNVFEGRKAVEAARKYGRIVQAGTQCRSSVGLIEAIACSANLWNAGRGCCRLCWRSSSCPSSCMVRSAVT